MSRVVVIGAINWDTTIFVRKFPQAGEETIVHQIIQTPGGKGGNAATAAARLLDRNQVAIFGGIGGDSIAAEQLRMFEVEGVNVAGLKRTEEQQSGQAFVVVDETGENLIYTHPGANVSFSPDDLNEPTRKDQISRASCIAIINPPLETAIKLAHEARTLGKRIIYDPGVNAEKGLGQLQSIIKCTDYIIANESEVRNLTGTVDSVKASEILRRCNPQLKVVTKLAARGSIMFGIDEIVQCEALDLQTIGMRVTNTVGCGDAFLGAFTVALSENLPDLDALRWGSCCAGLKAAKPETRGGPNRETLLRHVGQVKVTKRPS
ncbi:MAG: PfkB family carbohydrate kinase [Candidatus Bathyarchaeia archaeon]